MGLYSIFSSEYACFTADKENVTADEETVIADGEKGLLITAPDVKTDMPDVKTDSTLLNNNDIEDVLPEGTTEIENKAGAEETVSGMKQYSFCCRMVSIYIIFCLCSWLALSKNERTIVLCCCFLIRRPLPSLDFIST